MGVLLDGEVGRRKRGAHGAKPEDDVVRHAIGQLRVAAHGTPPPIGASSFKRYGAKKKSARQPAAVTQSGTKFRKSASNRNVARKGKRYAALDRGSINDAGPARRSIASSQGGVRWVASSGCLNSTLRSVISAVSSYGSVTVSSTCRSRGHNAAVGGAKHSQHLSGNAVDFRVHGNIRGALAYLQGAGRVGGFKPVRNKV